MAYDDSYPTSESEIIIADCEPVNLNGHKDLDYINDWVYLTVENEIWRGKKLREEKPLQDKTQRECDIINVDFLTSFCNENQRRARKGCICKKDKTRPSTPRSTCPCARSICASSTYSHRISKSNTGRTTTKNLRKCSMRIAELAVPTKRQCIDTWRNKSYILPEFMVDRLKQHVMDQRPIVKIPEAIYCFQRQRPKSSKNCSASQNKKEIIDCEVLKPYNQMDTRTLCIIFGHKIAKILSNPLNLTLNSELENLSNVVASDIAQMFSKHKSISKQIYTKHYHKESIHKDVSNKITVWIASILEDLSLKLLEEDLRDLEEEEGPVLDFIDDLVDNVLNICEPPPVHASEESDTCDSSQDDIIGEESEIPLKPNEFSENKIITADQNLNTAADNLSSTTNEDKENENLSDVAHFRNEIWDLIHNVKKDTPGNINNSSTNEVEKENNKEIPSEVEVKDDDKIVNDSINVIQSDNDITNVTQNNEKTDRIDNDSTNVIENDENTDIIDNDLTKVIQNDEKTDKLDIDSTNVIQNDKIDNDTANEMQNDENTGKINNDSSNVQNDQVEVDTTNVMQNDEIGENIDPIDNADTNDSNVSEVFEIFTEDSDDEKSSKKVKFSVTDLVNSNEIAEGIKSSTMELTQLPENDEPDQTNWNSSKENIKSAIFFAEPNDHLLSDADESWPPELTERPILKVSNVSKSVTSLGNILEKDEKEITPAEIKANVINQQKTGDTSLQEKVIFTHHINQDTNTHTTEKYAIGSQTNQGSKEGFNESTIVASETTATKDKSKKVKDKNIDKSLIVPTLIDKPVNVDSFSKQANRQTNMGKTNTVNTTKVEKTADIGGGTEGNISQIDYSWKVHPKTAPSWVTSCGHGRGEPSEDSIPIQIKPTKVTESDLRKWCKDLEKAFTNLEMWKNWIENTCKETLFLLKKKEIACAALNRKGATNWIRLKRNIHKDAILWTKLHLRTEDNFKILKRKYNNIEIVTAEYCAMCTCNKTKTRRYINMEEYLRNITE